MSARPADRFSSAREMRDAVDRELQAPRAPIPPPSSGRALAVASLGAILLAGALGFASLQGEQPQEASPRRGGAPEAPASSPTEHQQASLPVATPRAPAMLPIRIASEPPAPFVDTHSARAVPAPPAPSSRRLPARNEAQPSVTTEAPATPVAHGVLISDYVEQLQELERVVSAVAESLESPGPLPPNPYR